MRSIYKRIQQEIILVRHSKRVLFFVFKRGAFSAGHNYRVALFFRSQGKKLLVLCLGINLGKQHGYLLYRHFLAIPKTSQKTGAVLQQVFLSKSLTSGFLTCSTRFALKMNNFKRQVIQEGGHHQSISKIIPSANYPTSSKKKKYKKINYYLFSRVFSIEKISPRQCRDERKTLLTFKEVRQYKCFKFRIQ